MLILDTGVIVAAADRADPQHAQCGRLLEAETEPMVTTAMVIAECAYLIDRELGPQAESLLYQSIIDGALLVEPTTADDWQRIRELMVQYADLRLGGTDASVIALAERFHVNRIATLNHRDFTVVKPNHTAALTLIP